MTEMGSKSEFFSEPLASMLVNEYRRDPDLHNAINNGDWESAKRIFDQNKSALSEPLNMFNEIPLLIAVKTERETNFAKKLVELMILEVPEALEHRDIYGMSALHVAARYCNKQMVVILAKECPNLVYVTSADQVYNTPNWLPVHWAALSADKESVLHLLDIMYNDNSREHTPLADTSGAELLAQLIISELYDVALDFLCHYPRLASIGIGRDHCDLTQVKPSQIFFPLRGAGCALTQIAKKCSAFPSGSRLMYSWKRFLYSLVPVRVQLEKYAGNNVRVDVQNPATISSSRNVQKYKWAQSLWEKLSNFVPLVKHIQQEKLMHEQSLLLVKLLCKEMRSADDFKATVSLVGTAVVEATKLGIHEVVEEIVSSFHNLIWAQDSQGRYILHMAIAHRHGNVVNLIYNMSEPKRVMVQSQDKDGNNVLHLAGKMAPPNKRKLVPGAALQMQRELQWFEEVKKFVQPTYKVMLNEEGLTPLEVFTEEHAELAKDGEKWMKDTANSLTIVAALIVTVVFAAAITVPGGNDGLKGFPIFSNKPAFIVFSIFDAISLFTSTTSLLMFLSILTSRYADIDFLYVLPKRLIIGLLTLFLSITSMMIAFSATLYMVFGQQKAWILIPVAALTCLPIASFVTLQFPLVMDLIYSTYGNSFDKKSDRQFY